MPPRRVFADCRLLAAWIFALYTFGLKQLESSRAAMLATVEPVAVVALGAAT